MDRSDDMSASGGRHPFLGQYKVREFSTLGLVQSRFKIH